MSYNVPWPKKNPCLSLFTLGPWNGLFSTLYLLYYMFLRKESPSFEHEYKLPLKQHMTALIHNLHYFLESSYLLPVLLLLPRGNWDFARDACANNAFYTIPSPMSWPHLYYCDWGEAVIKMSCWLLYSFSKKVPLMLQIVLFYSIYLLYICSL